MKWTHDSDNFGDYLCMYQPSRWLAMNTYCNVQSVNQTSLAHFRVLVAWIWGRWMIMLFSLHRWCSTRGINLVKHAVSGSWCPVGPPGGRGARGYGEFRRNTLSCGTLQGLSSCTPPSSVANPFSMGPSWPRFCCQGWLCDVMIVHALVLGLPLCFCERTSQRNSVVVRCDVRDLWHCGTQCVLACC